MTRGEFAMFIARGLGLSGDKQAAGAYSDLNTNTSLAAYIGAVSKAGIVTGNSDGTFKPNSFITRQEAAAMLNRAATYAGATVSLPQTVDSYLQRFKDRKQVGTWAKQDVAKSVYTGFMTGVTSTTFVPQANTTRAEAAIMIQRMLTYVGFLQS
ncbi:Endoglucanase precursor [compost metagenome]